MIIDLKSELTIKNAFRFPLQTTTSRNEIVKGGLLLLIPGIGWLLNMGHRIQFVHQMQKGQPAWPAWKNYPQLFKNGCVTFLGMLFYYVPSVFFTSVTFANVFTNKFQLDAH